MEFFGNTFSYTLKCGLSDSIPKNIFTSATSFSPSSGIEYNLILNFIKLCISAKFEFQFSYVLPTILIAYGFTFFHGLTI